MAALAGLNALPAVGQEIPPSPAICLDGRNQSLAEGTGVLTYAKTLAAGLKSLGRRSGVLLDHSPEQRIAGTMARYARAASPFSACASGLQTAPLGFDRAWVAEDVFRAAHIHFTMYGRLRRVRSDCLPGIMHWTYPLPLVFDAVPNIYTIHDLIPLTHPGLTSINSQRFARIVRQLIKRADHIVTVSEASRHDIIALLGVPEERVTNTYQPVQVSAQTGRLGTAPPNGYFLFCGTIEARKNIARLVAAYEASGVETPLIIAGPDGDDAERLLGSVTMTIRPLGAMMADGQRGVWRTPWLERPALLDLLSGARALLFPSLAEGFGLPIVEAMALGVPVLTSRGGATGEIAGDAALLVEPTDVHAIATAIATLDRNIELRASLAARGLHRAAHFTPDACLARLDAVYRKVGVSRI